MVWMGPAYRKTSTCCPADTLREGGREGGRQTDRQIIDLKELAHAALGLACVKSLDEQEAGTSGKRGCFRAVPSSLNMLSEHTRTTTTSKANV